MKRILLIASVIGLSGCSSAPKYAQNKPETQPDVVISRIDDMSERPPWLKEAAPFRIENGMVISMGIYTMPSDQRVESGFRIANNNAKAAISSAIEQKLSFILQNAEEGSSFDSSQVRYIGAEASEITSSTMRPMHQYWEKISTTLDSGERVTRYKIFAIVNMPEDEFKKAIYNAMNKGQGKGKISADFKEKVDKHWDEFRKPASE